MTTLADVKPREEISLLASLNGEWLKLPLSIMRDVGPAAQTLGGILKLSNRETFVSAGKIAERARLPVATVRKHLVKLQEGGWIDNAGRGHTRTGRARRTCTIKLTAKTKSTLGDYSILPWWACGHVTRVGGLPWSCKAVLSVVMSKLAAMNKAVEGQQGAELEDEFWGSLANIGGDDRFRFSLDRLERETGLHRETIVTAKRRLATLKIIDWRRGDDADLLCPNQAFRVVVTPMPEDRYHISFKGGSDSGQ